MALVFLDNVCVTLNGKLEKTGTILPISAADKAKLTDLLGTDGFSYLTLSSLSGNNEDIKIFPDSGEISIQRAQNNTEALTITTGRCACFKVTKAVLDEYLTNPPEVCRVTVESGSEDYIIVTEPTEGNCNWVISLSTPFIDRLNDCCPEDNCNSCTLSDGTYENSTITVVNGKICSVSNGKNIVYTGGSTCCNCGSCE